MRSAAVLVLLCACGGSSVGLGPEMDAATVGDAGTDRRVGMGMGDSGGAVDSSTTVDSAAGDASVDTTSPGDSGKDAAIDVSIDAGKDARAFDASAEAALDSGIIEIAVDAGLQCTSGVYCPGCCMLSPPPPIQPDSIYVCVPGTAKDECGTTLMPTVIGGMSQPLLCASCGGTLECRIVFDGGHYQCF